jgi:hypothetical protein
MMMRRFPARLWLFALLLASVTSLPYLTGYLNTPPGWVYSGAPGVPTGTQVDFNSHMAKMWQGMRGQWDYQLLFTHEDHPGIPLVQGFYVALGSLAGITPFSLPLIYHIARFILTAGMVLAIWAFASYLFEKTSERWLATLFATIVGGWSWLLLFISPQMTQQVSPIEFWLSDAFNLLGALYMPHFAAAIILQIVIVLSYEKWIRLPNTDMGLEGVRWRSLVILTLALAAESIVQPYVILLLAPLLVILTAYHVFSAKRFSWQQALWLLIPLGIHALIVAYQYLTISADPVWAKFTDQNQTLSPLVTYYLLGYLPFIIPIVLGARRFMLDTADDRWWLPILWVGLVAVLLYAPFPTQRRYLLGVQTPLAALAAYGWTKGVLPRLMPRRRPLVTILYFALASVALIRIIGENANAMATPLLNERLFYQPDELLGYAWLQRETTGRGDVVLTTFDTTGQGSGGRLVAATGQRVFIGHWFETVDFENKVAQVRRFYDPATTDDWRREFLNDIGAVYVWYDDYARATGDWNPSTASYLEAAFTSDTVTIYRVLESP